MSNSLTKRQLEDLNWFIKNEPVGSFDSSAPTRAMRRRLVALGLIEHKRSVSGVSYRVTTAGHEAVRTAKAPPLRWAADQVVALTEKWGRIDQPSASKIAAEINEKFGTSYSRNAVMSKVWQLGLPRRKTDDQLRQAREASARWRQNYTSPYLAAGLDQPSPGSRIPREVENDRDRRLGIAHDSLTAAIFGDPLPGYSALDRRTAQ